MVQRLFKMHVYVVSVLIPLLDNFLGLKQMLSVITPPAWCEIYKGVSVEKVCEVVADRIKNPVLMKRRKCLRHGFMLFHFLCLAGAPAVLQIGVFARKQYHKGTVAHCWVTCDGRSLSPEPQEDVAVILIHRKKQYFNTNLISTPKDSIKHYEF
jgi:hypothetical protein